MKKQQPALTISIKRSILTILATSLLMGGSIAALYIGTRLDAPTSTSRCKGASQSTSADGMVVIDEADLGCLGEAQRLQESVQAEKNINNVVLIIGGISLISNVASIIYLYRRV